MPTVSNCPACKEKITIPDGVADDAALRCPLCQAQFALSDVALAATAAPPVAVLVDAESELAANDAEPEVTESVEATDELAEGEDAVEDSPAVAESEDSLAAEVESLRSKTETFEGSADPSADDPGNLQVQADELAQEAQALLAKVGQSTYEAKEAEAKAMALVARAMGYRKSTSSALGALADALDAVARSVDDKCETLMAELGEKPATVEEDQAEHEEEPRAEESEAGESEETRPAEEPKDPFAFLSEGRSDEAESEAEPEAAAKEEELVVEESSPATEETESSDKKTDMFAFLSQTDEAGEEKADASDSEQDLTLEDPESAAADESEASSELEIASESETSVDTSETADAESKDEQLELAAESPAIEATEPSVDIEMLRTRLDSLLAVASALKARAAELREEANSLLDESAEYAIQGDAGEGWGNAPWQPDGESSASDVGAAGVGAFSFGGGAAGAAAPGRSVRPGRRKKETSFVKELIGIVLGGAGGLLIAYYGLNFFGGVRYDFAKIYLPGIKHTVKHRPAWWPTWARFEGSEEVAEEAGVEQVWEEAALAQPSAPVEPKTPKAAKKSKAVKKPARTAPELPEEPAFAAPPELPSQPGLMASPDLGASPDLMASPDLGAPPELSISPDLAAPADMTISPDLAAPSSVSLSPELMGTPQPKPSKPDATDEEGKPAATEKEEAKPAPTKEEKAATEKKTPAKQEEAKSTPVKKEEAKPAPAKETATAPESKSAAIPVSYVDLKKRPKYGSEDLTKALKALPETIGCPKCNSTGQVDGDVCPDCQGHPSVAYSELCRLGEVLAFVEAAESEPLDSRKTEALALIEKFGSKPELVKEIGSLAVSRLDDEDRPSPGILFAGTVVETGAKGKLQAATIKLAGVERMLKVISKEPMDLTSKDRVLVLGCLVRNNSANVADTAAGLFVWRGMVVKFSKETE